MPGALGRSSKPHNRADRLAVAIEAAVVGEEEGGRGENGSL